jgi:acetoin utilization deacetylase AcuC-like enzyme
LKPPAGEAEYLAALDGIHSRLVAFRPELVLVSAGFDAHVRDPLGGERGTGMRVTTEGYGRIVSKILDLSREAAAGRCVFGLEGGYDLDALTACIEISLTRMVEQRRRLDAGRVR